MLASQILPKYQDKKCAILALNDGGAMVGIEIAKQLNCFLTLLLGSEILLPREPETFAGINADGKVTYNPAYSDGEQEEMKSEFFGLIKKKKMLGMHKLNRLVGKGGQVSRKLLKGRNIIIVSDGMQDGFALDMAMQYLKPIETDKIIVATPFASIPAVDRMHVLADDLYCMNVIDNYISTDHYYDQHDVPEHEAVLSAVDDMTASWE